MPEEEEWPSFMFLTAIVGSEEEYDEAIRAGVKPENIWGRPDSDGSKEERVSGVVEELTFVHLNGLEEPWPIKNPEAGRTYQGRIRRVVKLAPPHTCSPPKGWGERYDILTCQTCGARWMYLKPFGMYPGWTKIEKEQTDEQGTEA